MIPWFPLYVPSGLIRLAGSKLRPHTPSKLRRILLTRVQYLGDCVVFLPTIAAVKRAWPQARLDVFAGTSVGEAVFKMCPLVDRVVRTDWGSSRGAWDRVREIEAIRREHYDAVLISTQETGSAAKMFLAGIPFRAGFGVINHDGREYRESSPALLSLVLEQHPNTHEVQSNIQLAKAVGGEDLSVEFCLRPTPRAGATVEALLESLNLKTGEFVCVHAGSKQIRNRWPLESFAQVCDYIQSQGIGVVLVGSSGEQSLSEQLADLMPRKPANVTGRTDIDELAALLGRAAAFFGNNSGPMHLAAACRVPVVAVSGSSDPEVWGPWLPPERQRLFDMSAAVPEAVQAAVLELVRLKRN